MKDLKQKMAISMRQKKLQLLTLAPPSWTIEQTQGYVGVSAYLMNKARVLKVSGWILAEPMAKKGKISACKYSRCCPCFFEDDDISRQCPGKNDFVSIKINGKPEQKQKRLILSNLNEVSVQFKELHPLLKIGISKLCELRPKWCVTVGAQGRYTFCLCLHHTPEP